MTANILMEIPISAKLFLCSDAYTYKDFKKKFKIIDSRILSHIDMHVEFCRN